MNILALDLGTRCGWALRENGRIESGVQVFDVKRGESPGMRYVRFRRWLESAAMHHEGILTAYPSLIVYEQTHNRGGAATEVAAGFATRVQEFCAQHRLEHAAIHTATLKKFTTGSGRGDKGAMHRAAVERNWLGLDTVAADDNEVDAICLLHYALEELAPSDSADNGIPAERDPAPLREVRDRGRATAEPSRADDTGRGA